MIESSQQKRPQTYLDLIQKVGGKGKYQYIFVAVQAISYFVTGVLLMSDAFMFNNPQFDCPSFGLLTDDCYSTVCSLPPDQWSRYVTEESSRFRSLANSFESTYYCEDEIYLNLYSTAPFLGTAIGGIVIGALADNIGRRKAMLIGNILTIMGSLILIFAQDLWMASLGLVICGSGSDAVYALYFTLGAECINDNFRQKVAALVQIAFMAGALLSTLFYFLFQDWQITNIFCLVIPALICGIAATLTAKESPMYLIRESPQKALKEINEIGLMNKGKADILEIEDIQSVMRHQETEKNNVTSTFADIFRFRSLRWVTLSLGVVCMCVSMLYYGPILIIDQFGLDIYTSSTALNVADLLTYYPLMLLIDKVKRKSFASILFSTATVISIALIFIVAPEDCDMCPTLFVQVGLVSIFRFAVSMVYAVIQIYATQLYPTRVRNIGIAVLATFDTATSTIAPLIMGALARAQLNPFTLFTVLGLVSIAFFMFLPETFGKLCPQEIEEVEEQRINKSILLKTIQEQQGQA